MKLALLKEEHFEQIARLEAHLWGGDYEYRLQMLRWKYLHIPTQKCLGVVAFEGEAIVGFRGLVASEWKYQSRIIKNLHYTDAVVHPDFRGKGILGMMNDFISREFQNDFDFIMVFFPNEISGHIYKKQGVSNLMHVSIFHRRFFIPFSISKNHRIITDFKLIASLIERREQAIFSFNYTPEYILWKSQEPNKTIVFLQSLSDPEIFTALEVNKYAVGILFFQLNHLDEIMKIAQNYAASNGKFYCNLTLTETQLDELKKNRGRKKFRTFKILNNLKKDFYQEKEILLKPLHQSVPIDEKMYSAKEAWEYNHFIYV